MELEIWMKERGFKIEQLAKVLGVTRQTIWKLRKGEPCEPETAQKLYFFTNGAVKPIVKKRGMPKGAKRVRKENVKT